MSAMKYLIAPVAIAIALGAAAFGISAIGPVAAETAPESSSSSSPPPKDAKPGEHRPGELLTEVLDGLVSDGTITKDQEDKILGAVKHKALEEGDGHGRGPRKH